MQTNFKDKIVEFIERWNWMTDEDDDIKSLYKFIDDNPVWEPFIDNFLKEIRINLYELSKEKSIVYINELISDLRIIEKNILPKTQLLKDYDNNLIKFPESGANKGFLDFLLDEKNSSKSKSVISKRKEISISDAIFILLNIHREYFLERLFIICQDFNLPFELNPDETTGQRLQEINSLQRKENSFNKPKQVDCHKIIVQWKGTPGEFGAIFNELIDNGFIALIRDKRTVVKLLHSVFEIRNEDGKPISENYLYRCFKDKIKKYPPNKLVIPFSDNYHNNK